MRRSTRQLGLLLGTALSLVMVGTCAQTNNLFSAQPDESATLIDRTLNAARQARADGDLDTAASRLAYLVSVAPDNADVLGEYGKVLTEMGRPDDGIAYLNRAIARDPQNWKLYNAVAVAYDEKHDFRSSASAYAKALALTPNNPAVLANDARSHILAGDTSGAQQLLAQANPTDESRVYFSGLESQLAAAEVAKHSDTAVASAAPAPLSTAPSEANSGETEAKYRAGEMIAAAPSTPATVTVDATPRTPAPAASAAPQASAQPVTAAPVAVAAVSQTVAPAAAPVSTVPAAPAVAPAPAPEEKPALAAASVETSASVQAVPTPPAADVVSQQARAEVPAAPTAVADNAPREAVQTTQQPLPSAPVVAEVASKPASTETAAPPAAPVETAAASEAAQTAPSTPVAASAPAAVMVSSKPVETIVASQTAQAVQAPAAPPVPVAPAVATETSSALAPAAPVPSPVVATPVALVATSSAPAPSPETNIAFAATAQASAGTHYFIRVGTWHSRKHAHHVAARLRPRDVHVARVNYRGRHYYRVWLAAPVQVQDALESVRSLGFLHARIIAKGDPAVARKFAGKTAPAQLAFDFMHQQ